MGKLGILQVTVVMSFVCLRHLYLCSVSCCDVGDGPACLFANGLFSTAEKVQQTWKG